MRIRDCGAPGMSMKHQLARNARRAPAPVRRDAIHARRLPFAEVRFEQWQHLIRRYVPDHDQGAVVRSVSGRVKGAEILGGQRLRLSAVPISGAALRCDGP